MNCKEMKQVLDVLYKTRASATYVFKDLVEIDFDKHTLRTQNSEFMVEHTLPDEVFLGRKKGVGLVDICALKDIFTGTEGEVFFFRKGDQLEVRAGSIRSYLKIKVDTQYFERFEGNMGRSPEKLPFADLKTFFEKLASCEARDDYRAVLNGTCLDKDNKKGVATDGHKLIALDLPFEPTKNVIIHNPAAYLKSIKGVKEIRVRSYDDVTFFKAGDCLVAAKHMDGEYSPWKRVIPTDTLPAVHINIKDIKASKQIANKCTHQVTMLFEKSGEVSYFGRKDGDSDYSIITGTYKGECPTFALEGKQIGFNSVFLFNLMKAMGGNPEICFVDSDSATVMHNEAGDLALIMPVKIEKVDRSEKKEDVAV